MAADWVTGLSFAAAGAIGGFIYWGSSLLFERVRARLRAR